MATQIFPTVPGASGGSSAAATFAGMFGDGADGNYTVIAGASLSPGRERHYADLTVQATGKVLPRGFRLCVSGTLTNAGEIIDEPPHSDYGSGAAGFAQAQFLGVASGNGFNGRSSTGAGTAGGVPAGTASYNNSGVLSQGGNGGNANAQLGGTGGAFGSAGNARFASLVWLGRYHNGFWAGGSGGGSGAVDVSAGGNGNSGAGGAGGGIVWLAAKTINNAGGVIGARGGNGGIGSGAAPGVAGGGGGGGGGLVGILTTTPVADIGGTVSAAGGTGGTGFNGGGAGAPGTACSVNIVVFA